MHCRKKVHDNLGALAKQVEFQIARQKELKAKNSIVGTSNSQSEDIDVSSEKKLDIYSAEHKENS